MRRVGLVGALLGLLLAVGSAVPALASPTECDWEWGGVPEATPEPCSTPVLVLHDGAVTTIPDNAYGPWAVQIESSVTELQTTGTVALDDTGPFAEGVFLGIGLLVFLVAVFTVASFARRGR